MNNAKRTINLQNQKPSKKKQENRKAGVILAGIGAAILVILCVIIGYEQLHRPLLVKVNDKKINLDDMMYYIYTTEANYNYMSQIYGVNYWEQAGSDGKTARETAKEETMNAAIRYEVLYQEAMKANYKVKDEDKKSAAQGTKAVMDQMTKDQKIITRLTKEKITNILTRNALCDRYRKDLIDTFNIDDKAIKDGIKYEDFRQYNIQRYFIKTKTMDSKGKEKDVSDTVKKDYFNQMTALLEKAKTAKDFTKLVDLKAKDNVIDYQEANFIKTDTTFDDNLKTQMMSLKNGEISGLLEGKDGYYIVKMINNNSKERYNSEVKNAISQKESEAFEKEYKKILKGYKVTINQKEWNKIELGNYTIKK